MFIEWMSLTHCHQALEKASLGRLGCARDNQPYVVPTYFAFDGTSIYGFSTLGQKITWMRDNPCVCLEIDERITHDQWMSVVVTGRYEELPDRPAYESARRHAYKLLQRQPMWWEPAAIPAIHHNQETTFVPVYYRILIDQISGMRATPSLAPHRVDNH